MLNVVVTGGTRGLGLAIVQRLADLGYRVFAVARSRSEAIDHAEHAPPEGGGGEVIFRPYDLAELDGIGAFVGGIAREYGPLHALINNAAHGAGGLLANMRDNQIERLLQLNVISPITLTKYAARSMMVGAGGGRIVNISSIIATTGYPGLSVYAASKAALCGFTRSLARELGPLGITVNAVAPGFIHTEMTRDMAEADIVRVARRSALRKLAEPRDVAGAVAYLLSDDARNVTGTTMTVDAGNTA